MRIPDHGALIVWLMGLIAALGLAWALWGPSTADSAEFDRGAWFKSLKQPDTGYGCCDISDCHVTDEAEFRDGEWWARRSTGV